MRWVTQVQGLTPRGLPWGLRRLGQAQTRSSQDPKHCKTHVMTISKYLGCYLV